MTFNKMRFPVVWITFALCVVLCANEVQAGPVGSPKDVDVVFYEKDQDLLQPTDLVRSVRQAVYDETDDESEEHDDDEEEQQLNFPASLNQEDNDDDGDDYDGRSLRRSIRDASQKPVIEEELDEESVNPTVVAPTLPEKKPTVLELLSTALDKAIEATSKIPTQQVASDAAGVFQILGQVFTEAIDKVIGTDDGPDDVAEILAETSDQLRPEPAALPVDEPPIKVDEPVQETSQSDKEAANNL